VPVIWRERSVAGGLRRLASSIGVVLAALVKELARWRRLEV
jgi:hypothetical protein